MKNIQSFSGHYIFRQFFYSSYMFFMCEDVFFFYKKIMLSMTGIFQQVIERERQQHLNSGCIPNK